MNHLKLDKIKLTNFAKRHFEREASGTRIPFSVEDFEFQLEDYRVGYNE